MQIPATQSLLAFEVLARHLNMRKAAEELCLTAGAVSKQLGSLETILGVELFTRTKQGLTLNNDGRDYLESVKHALSKLSEAGVRVSRRQSRSQFLHIQVPPSFADRWLLPRYAELTKTDLGGKIMFSTYPFIQPDQDFPYSFDGYVYVGKGDWPDCGKEYICGKELVLVASPKYLSKILPIKSPSDMEGCTILEHSELPLIWVHAFKHLNLKSNQVVHTAPFDLYSILIRSAVVGLGIAIIPEAFISAELQSGELVPILDYRKIEQFGYDFIYLKGQKNEELIRRFRIWLKEQKDLG